MSIPTFNSVALCSAAARDEPGPIDARTQVEALPGSDGQFVQCHGNGGRDIRVTGILEGSGDTPGESNQTLKAAMRTLQALAAGATVATYVGTDGSNYSFCILTAYRAAGPVQVRKDTTGYTAMVAIEAVIRNLAP